MSFMSFMYVAVGGALGSMLRYLVMLLVTRAHTSDFPFGTMAVNILGGFLMGVWIASMATMLPARAKELHLLFAVGVLGGFTTFSAFTLDLYLLYERGHFLQAALYVGGSLSLSLFGLIMGMWCLKYLSA